MKKNINSVEFHIIAFSEQTKEKKWQQLSHTLKKFLDYTDNTDRIVYTKNIKISHYYHYSYNGTIAPPSEILFVKILKPALSVDRRVLFCLGPGFDFFFL